MSWALGIRPYWGYFVSHPKDAIGCGFLLYSGKDFGVFISSNSAEKTYFQHSTFATRVEPELTEPHRGFTCVNPSYLPLAPCVLIGLEP